MLKKISFVVLVLLLFGILTLDVFAVSKSKAGVEIYSGVEPLEEPVKVRFALFAGSMQTFPFYLMEKLGGLEMVGISAEFSVFGTGPVMVEAQNSWDISSYGIGGVLVGTQVHRTGLVAATMNDLALRIYAHKDDPIVKAGNNIPECPELYGTKETWKGREIYLPTGTTMHYTTLLALAKFGLTEKDIKITHMSATSAVTALRAGKGGELASATGPVAFSKEFEENNFVPVIDAKDVDVGIVCAMAVNPDFCKDPKYAPVIKKVLEMWFITTKWIEENIEEEAKDLFIIMAEGQGVKIDPEAIIAYSKRSTFPTLEENYEWATTMTKANDGRMMKVIEAKAYNPTIFFIEKGNYEPEILDQILSGVFMTEYIEEIYEAQQK